MVAVPLAAMCCIYRMMSEVRDEDQYAATMVNHAELLLSGCTTSVDHSYLKVNDMRFDTQIHAAQEIGIRFHLARGSSPSGAEQRRRPAATTWWKMKTKSWPTWNA